MRLGLFEKNGSGLRVRSSEALCRKWGVGSIVVLENLHPFIRPG